MYLNRRTNTFTALTSVPAGSARGRPANPPSGPLRELFADSTPERPVPRPVPRETMLLSNVLSNYTELVRGFEAGDANPYKKNAMIELWEPCQSFESVEAFASSSEMRTIRETIRLRDMAKQYAQMRGERVRTTVAIVSCDLKKRVVRFPFEQVRKHPLSDRGYTASDVAQDVPPPLPRGHVLVTNSPVGRDSSTDKRNQSSEA
jgi:hypothetical protein